ncbi:MAG: ribonuclease P protein component, partial [Fidelibacterota bacterium]
MSPQFTREQRLTRREEFERVFSQGRRVTHAGITAWLLPSESPRIGCAVSRRYGNPVHRNKLKRRVRAAFRQHMDQLPSNDIVITATAKRGWVTYPQIE